MKKLLSLILILTFLLSFAVINVSAACSLSVAPSKSTIYIGDTVTVTLSFTGSESIESIDGIVSFDDSKLEYKSISGGFGTSLVPQVSGKTIQFSDFYMGTETMPKTYSVKLTFKAKAVGDAKVSVTSSDVGGSSDSSIGAPTGSTTVSVKQENKSNNANLKWLTVPKGCTLVPKFSKDVTNYTCTVPGSVTSFPMDWEKEDPKATDAVSGALSLKVGENTRKVTVTAQDGTKKVYTVKITRLAPEQTPISTPTPTVTPAPTEAPVKVFVDEQEYTLNSTISLTMPEGYNKETVLYNGNEIEAAVLGGVTLVQLNDGSRDMFFVYDKTKDDFSAFKQISHPDNQYTVIEEKPDCLPADIKDTHKVIGDGEYTVWPFDKFGEGYYIIHIMNDLGEKYPAVYCEADGSIQKLSLKMFEAQQTGGEIENTPKLPVVNNMEIDWMLVAIVVSALILIAIIVIIIVLLAKNSKQQKEQAPKRQWGFEDPYDINIEQEVTPVKTQNEDDIDFN